MSYQAAILTVSDSCAAGTRTDTSGPAIRAMLENAGFAVQAMQTVPDEEGQISAAIVHACDILQADLVVTTGGHRALSVRRDAGGDACRARPRDPRHPRRHVGRGTEVDAAGDAFPCSRRNQGAYARAERPGLGKGGARKSRRRRRDARSRAQNARGRWALTSKKHALRLQRVLFHFF